MLGQTARKAVRSGVLWGALFGVLVASSAVSYTKIYTTAAERDALAKAFGANHATAALFGPAPDLDTIAGFVVLKSFMTIIVLGAIWGLLTSTRLLRGEEDAGRWDLLLCGPITVRRATAEALAAFGGAVLGMWGVTALLTVGTGRLARVDLAAGACLYFALAQVAAAMMFVAVGAVTSQLAPTRRQAVALGGWILGFSYLLRMVADAGVGLHWIIWVTPLGWVEELQPLTKPDPLAFIPVIGLTTAAALLAVRLSAIRDPRGSIVPDRDHAPARLGLLSGQFGLNVRLIRPTVTGWLCAIAITGVVLGLVAKQAGGTISGSSVQEVFARLGVPGVGATAFLGISFLIVAVLLGFVAAGQATTARAEEAGGRISNLAAGPLRRCSWLAGRAVIALCVLLATGLLAGVSAWVGTKAGGGGSTLTGLLEAGINVVPPAYCLLGIGFLAFGARPRWTATAVYTVLGWSLLVELIGGFGSGGRWLLDTSLFHQMAASPAVSPDWTTSAWLVVVGTFCTSLGLWWFGRRDLVGN